MGGVAEVYRSTDTKLKRHVAIKVLPSSLAAFHERLARFRRDPEVLASLNTVIAETTSTPITVLLNWRP